MPSDGARSERDDNVRLGRVIGSVVSTRKHEKLEEAKLLLVQPLTAGDEPSGPPLLAIDAAQAGAGDKVLVVIEGRAAGSALRRRAAPVDAAIVGVVDQVDVPDQPASRGWPFLRRKETRGG